MWLYHMALGAYFGEVLVRSLNGKWRYPSRVRALMALLFSRPDLLYSHWYVMVGRIKVPVFELARDREMFGPNESLVKAYREIKNGTYRRKRRLRETAIPSANP